MTEQDPTDRAAIDSARNDAEFPDDERGLTGVPADVDHATDPEGQTARDISYEDDGVPDIADDDHQTAALAEDPQFAPVPGERPGASADFGTTAFEQSQGEPLSGRLQREETDDGLDPTDDLRAAETHDRTVPQIEQDGVSDRADSFTDTVTDDVVATGEDPTGGEGPEARAMHLTDG